MIASDQKTASVILILDHTTGLDTVGHFKLLIILYHDTGVQGILLISGVNLYLWVELRESKLILTFLITFI